MRGSVYYQSSQLVQQIFKEGVKKQDKVNPFHEDYEMVASYQTMDTYRSIWNSFFNYIKEHWKIRDCEKISSEHIVAYMQYKIEDYPSLQYFEKISAAFGKLEIALKNFAKNIHGIVKSYDFSIRKTILKSAKNLKLVASNYRNRAYKNPELLISNLIDDEHKLAAKIQYESGARIEGVALIKPEQLQGTKIDPITNKEVGIIWTKEKGGKEGEVLVSIETYEDLEKHFELNMCFKINRQAYYNDIKLAAILSKETPEASHGLRWNFAQRRMSEYARVGYNYDDCLQQVSYEMKHNRAKITKHYLSKSC